MCCLDQMIQLQAKNLKSGWKALLKVLVLSANDEDEMIVNLGFRIAESVLDEHFAEIKDVFADMSHCIVAFGCNKTNTTASLKGANLVPADANGSITLLSASSQQAVRERIFEARLEEFRIKRARRTLAKGVAAICAEARLRPAR